MYQQNHSLSYSKYETVKIAIQQETEESTNVNSLSRHNDVSVTQKIHYKSTTHLQTNLLTSKTKKKRGQATSSKLAIGYSQHEQ